MEDKILTARPQRKKAVLWGRKKMSSQSGHCRRIARSPMFGPVVQETARRQTPADDMKQIITSSWGEKQWTVGLLSTQEKYSWVPTSSGMQTAANAILPLRISLRFYRITEYVSGHKLDFLVFLLLFMLTVLQKQDMNIWNLNDADLYLSAHRLLTVSPDALYSLLMNLALKLPAAELCSSSGAVGD